MPHKLSCFATPASGVAGLHVLRNAQGMAVTISEHGAAMVSWWAPDRAGRMADVLLGYADSAAYADNRSYFGAVVGRWANRIAQGSFPLGGKIVQVDVNDRGQHLHGGPNGFHSARWQPVADDVDDADASPATAARADSASLTLRHISPDGEGGFPGTVQAQVRYRLADDGSLIIGYEAVTDAPTPINLTVHPYFNLNGGSTTIGRHLLQIDADAYLAIDAASIPLWPVPVDGTPFDFRQPAAIGPRLDSSDPQVRLVGGFDHCFCLRPTASGEQGVLREVARVADPDSGRQLTVSTTEIGLQFYSGNMLAGVAGRGSRPYALHEGFCLEAQAFPDQVNGPHAEQVILLPGQVYRQTTVYRLDLRS
jgi:aldose 1-epimerase